MAGYYYAGSFEVTPEGVAFDEASMDVRRLQYEVLDALKDVVRHPLGSPERIEAHLAHQRLVELAGDAQIRLNRAAAELGIHWTAGLGSRP